MRLAYCLLNDYGPAATYIHVEGHRYAGIACSGPDDGGD